MFFLGGSERVPIPLRLRTSLGKKIERQFPKQNSIAFFSSVSFKGFFNFISSEKIVETHDCFVAFEVESKNSSLEIGVYDSEGVCIFRNDDERHTRLQRS